MSSISINRFHAIWRAWRACLETRKRPLTYIETVSFNKSRRGTMDVARKEGPQCRVRGINPHSTALYVSALTFLAMKMGHR